MNNKTKTIIFICLLLVLGVVIYITIKNASDKVEVTDTKCFTIDKETGEIKSYTEICGTEVNVPDKIDNVEVKKIGSNVFNNKGITKIVLPTTLEEIGIMAFSNNSIEKVEIPESVKVIKPYAFFNNKISKLKISKNIETIGFEAFNKNEMSGKEAFIYQPSNGAYDETMLIGYAGKDKNVKIPSNVTMLYLNALSECEIESVELNSNLERILSNALSDNKIESIIIPESVTIVESSALEGNDLKEIIVEGKKSISEFASFPEEYKDLVKFK